MAEDAIKNGILRKEYPHAFRAEYASDWDCGYETSYWYVIKDTPFDVNALKAKRRYEITKGCRNFTVRRVNVKDEVDGMYSVYKEAISLSVMAHETCFTRLIFRTTYKSILDSGKHIADLMSYIVRFLDL